MNTHKQILAMTALIFVLAGSCAAYTAIDLPYRSDIKAKYQNEESIARGALLFANNCRACHGDRGQGGVGLPLNTDAYKSQAPLKLDQNRAKLRTTLYCGRLGTFMQPWLNTNGGSLNTVQIQHLIDLITDPTGAGWDEAREFSHNLNHESVAVIGGDTVASIAKTFRVGLPELEALNPRYAPDDPLPKGAMIKLPANSQFPDGREYKVTKSNDSLTKIADNQRVGAAILVDLNAASIEPNKIYSYAFDAKKNVFTLFVDGKPVFGLFPGAILSLPPGLSYVLTDTDTIANVAKRLEVSVRDLRSLNGEIEALGDSEAAGSLAGLAIQLPPIGTYLVRGQSLVDLAAGYAGLRDGAREFADENGIDPTHVLRIGQPLKIPPSSWGTAVSGTPNNGKACIEHAVPGSVFDELTGASQEPDQPAEASTDVTIVAHANDWQVVADGIEQEPNKGAVTVAPGASVLFRDDIGIHTITVEGTKDGDDLFAGDERTFTFNEPGTYRITCNYHPDMRAWVFVAE